MKVLHVCSELYPLLKTGGLADVMGALPFAQKEIGIDTRIVLPAYPALQQEFLTLAWWRNLIILPAILFYVTANITVSAFI